jgi:hypothetical protein
MFRKCIFPGCRTILNSYNHGEYCSLHQKEREKVEECATIKVAVLLTKESIKEVVLCWWDDPDYFLRLKKEGFAIVKLQRSQKEIHEIMNLANLLNKMQAQDDLSCGDSGMLCVTIPNLIVQALEKLANKK